MLLMNWLRSVGHTCRRKGTAARNSLTRGRRAAKAGSPGEHRTIEPLEPRVLLAGITGFDTAVLASSPLAYWRLNETSGTTAADATGNGNAGTYNTGVVLGQPSVLADGRAAEFNGTTGEVALGITPPTNNFTLVA